jgi:hypothetical protein
MNDSEQELIKSLFSSLYSVRDDISILCSSSRPVVRVLANALRTTLNAVELQVSMVSNQIDTYVIKEAKGKLD